jgi:hypothetical protein
MFPMRPHVGVFYLGWRLVSHESQELMILSEPVLEISDICEIQEFYTESL